MVVVVPDAIEGLPEIEARFADLDLNQILKEGRKREIILTMPKFKLEQTIELNDILQKVSWINYFAQTCTLTN